MRKSRLLSPQVYIFREGGVLKSNVIAITPQFTSFLDNMSALDAPSPPIVAPDVPSRRPDVRRAFDIAGSPYSHPLQTI